MSGNGHARNALDSYSKEWLRIRKQTWIINDRRISARVETEKASHMLRVRCGKRNRIASSDNTETVLTKTRYDSEKKSEYVTNYNKIDN